MEKDPVCGMLVDRQAGGWAAPVPGKNVLLVQPCLPRSVRSGAAALRPNR